MMGILARSWLSRIWRQTSNPLPPGTMISSKKRIGGCLRARGNTWSPEAETRTAKPANCRWWLTRLPISASSSRTIMFCFTRVWTPLRNDFNRKYQNLSSPGPQPIVSRWKGCYHQSVNRNKTFLAKITIGVALAMSAVMYAAGPAMVLPSVPSSVDTITPGELRMHLEFLASQELGGRYTLSPSFAIAARYLASRLEAYGFKGAGERGDFLQTFQVISAKPDPAKSSLEITNGTKTSAYHFGDFYTLGTSSGEGQGQVVFVGTGVSSPSQQHDDYSGMDVRGKIVMIASGMPAGVDAARLGDNEQGEGAARAHGAVGIMQIPAQRFLEFMKSKGFQDRAASRESIRLAREGEGALPSITLGPDLAEQLLAAGGLDLKTVYESINHKEKLLPKNLNVSAKIAVSMQITRTTTQNVAATLEGTDPKLKSEYVVFSAHYDHLKTGPNGEVYPGADDDGSGTTAILTIAHALSLERPKRSVLVMFHAGEELGLLGSQYNTDFAPAVPLDKMVADLNIDM